MAVKYDRHQYLAVDGIGGGRNCGDDGIVREVAVVKDALHPCYFYYSDYYVHRTGIISSQCHYLDMGR